MHLFLLLKYSIIIERTAGGLLSLSSYFQSVSAFVISAGCIKSVTALQQIDLPDGRHENTAMASARTGVCASVCVSVCLCVLCSVLMNSCMQVKSF